ncbi:tRNA adenosine(34) deaminase TadA [Hahella ganghwensis]|uniref:tRNA adenosine(34) deaminase TadA n=1 Tax=Hahella ganghwensis TaxID=286420 RepID=UPI0003760CE0|nr:tRNA adenosine(34) deaminase TadA [Hahella ganghwensis]
MSGDIVGHSDDEYWMREALQLARRAYDSGEVPVGALVVHEGRLLGDGYNQPIISHDPTAHAEIMALRVACSKMENYRIPGATLYVTLEPCTMCVGAIVHARVSRLVFGAAEPKAGAVGSQSNLLEKHPFNWDVEVRGGVLQDECSLLISDFFRERRQVKKSSGRKA